MEHIFLLSNALKKVLKMVEFGLKLTFNVEKYIFIPNY